MKHKGMSFVQLFREDINIFEQNPELKEHEPFSELYEMGIKGDMIMGALYRIYDIKSTYYSTVENEDDRVKEVNKTYLDNEDFDWRPYKTHIAAYKQDCRTELQRKLDLYREDLEGRETYFRSLRWDDPQDRYDKDQMLNTQPKMLAQYDEIKKQVESEIEELESLAGYRKSFLEQLAIDLAEKG